MNIIEQIKSWAIDFFHDAKGSHDWDHTMRVYNLSLHIGQREKADLEILGIAAILHDIGRKYQDKSRGKVCHAEKGAEIARELLPKFFISQERIEKIVHCIVCHRSRGENIPKSLEAKILFDADKLDGIGAIGIGRAFSFSGEIGARVHNKEVDINNTKSYTKEDTAYREFLVSLIRIKDKMFTKEGKRIAKGRHDFMVRFFERLNMEVDGEI